MHFKLDNTIRKILSIKKPLNEFFKKHPNHMKHFIKFYEAEEKIKADELEKKRYLTAYNERVN